MPCDTVTTQSIKLAKAMPELLKQAMEDLKWNVTSSTATRIVAKNSNYDTFFWNINEGITAKGMSNLESEVSKLSKAYSKRAVTWAAQRAGWKVTASNEDTLTVTRRT